MRKLLNASMFPMAMLLVGQLWAAAAEPPHKAMVSTTMDFLDLSGFPNYYPDEEDQGYLTLSQYEK